jgi:hypothetical protein
MSHSTVQLSDLPRPSVQLAPVRRTAVQVRTSAGAPVQVKRVARPAVQVLPVQALAVVASSEPTDEVLVTPPTQAHRIWQVDVCVTVAGRAPFVVHEQVLLPLYLAGPEVGSQVPAIVHPLFPQASIDFSHVPGVSEALAATTGVESVRVHVSDDLVDPLEVNDLYADHVAGELEQV